MRIEGPRKLRASAWIYEPKLNGLPVREETLIPTASGGFAVNSRTILAGTVALHQANIGSQALGVTVLRKEYVGFMIPLVSSGEFLLNGEPINCRDLYISANTDAFHVSGDARVNLGAGMPKRPFLETIAALRGVPVDDQLVTRVKLSTLQGMRLREALQQVLAHRQRDATQGELGDLIMQPIIDAVLSADSKVEEVRGNWWRNEKRIVDLAEDFFAMAAGGPLSLADLCRASGVSKSTLYRAFANVCGMPPLAYFYKRRLTAARSHLLRSRPRNGGVTQAVMASGLSDLSRFSIDYRRLFGESPSVTLKSTLG